LKSLPDTGSHSHKESPRGQDEGFWNRRLKVQKNANEPFTRMHPDGPVQSPAEGPPWIEPKTLNVEGPVGLWMKSR